MTNQVQEILTVEDVMEVLKIGKNHVYSLLASGDLDGFQLGRTWKIPAKRLNEFIDRKSAE